MYLEREVYSLLVWGFSIIMLAAVIVLISLYMKARNKGLLWLGGQLIFTSAAFYYFYKAIRYLPNQGNDMYSEIQSLTIAAAGIFWAFSMVCMLIGICKLIRITGAEHE